MHAFLGCCVSCDVVHYKNDACLPRKRVDCIVESAGVSRFKKGGSMSIVSSFRTSASFFPHCDFGGVFDLGAKFRVNPMSRGSNTPHRRQLENSELKLKGAESPLRRYRRSFLPVFLFDSPGSAHD
jgi:hypothetical protein